ncbi:MAG: aminoacetone oxidase family FAD-binding enzyme, partial [Clostridia bacterium]|nr:aminoacetone oxidase family FAD-binding enzyme [Clostridia bacterium]
MSKTVTVIGGGAAGMMAAGSAAEAGHYVRLIEQNKILGKKLLITGKGRCNLTNACDDVETLLKNVVTNRRFLYSAFYGFDNFQTMAFFEGQGLKLKTERGGRVFPESDKSADVSAALRRYMSNGGVEIIRDRADDVRTEGGRVSGVMCQKHGFIPSDSVILATGGISYPVTGSTGDGHTFAENLGHTITPLRPSLVPLTVAEDWLTPLSGLSLKNISITVKNSGGKTVYTDFGEMMLAHFGLTGPVILSASAHLKDMDSEKYTLHLDLKPALSAEKLNERILRDFSGNMNKDLINALDALLPKALIPVVISLCDIDPHKKINSVTSAERARLTELIKNIKFNITGFCPPEQAIITSGGVSVKEINPSTMESKLVRGLFFAGEIIDVDALTGGC